MWQFVYSSSAPLTCATSPVWRKRSGGSLAAKVSIELVIVVWIELQIPESPKAQKRNGWVEPTGGEVTK